MRSRLRSFAVVAAAISAAVALAACGSDDKPESTPAMEEHNTDTIVKALGG